MEVLWCETWWDVRRGRNQPRLTQVLEQFGSTEKCAGRGGGEGIWMWL